MSDKILLNDVEVDEKYLEHFIKQFECDPVVTIVKVSEGVYKTIIKSYTIDKSKYL